MRKFSRLLLVGLTIVLLGTLVIPVAAQEEERGGILINSTFGGDPGTFNPIYCTGTDCYDGALRFMYPGLVGADPETATIEMNQPDSLALTWDVSDDNLVYTFHLRDDMFWTDGAPVTSADVMYVWELYQIEEAEAPGAYLLDSIESVEAPDDYTLVITFYSPDCTALLDAGSIDIAPAHIFSEIEPAALEDWEFATNPYVSAGVFQFGEYRPSEVTILLPNHDYVDNELGYVGLDGYIYKVVPDQSVQMEQLLAGEINVSDYVPPDRKAEFRANEDLQIYDYPGNSWDYLAFNLADPTNPQPALDEDGNPIDQGVHPLFGGMEDATVRQAIAHAVNVDDIITGAVFGEAERMTAHIVPASWAYNDDLPPVSYDVALAEQMLTDAGWIDEDGDGIRECHGCPYAEEGTPFSFTLYTNAGNTRREAIGVVVQDQLAEVGLEVDFQAIDFNTLIDVFMSQEYDTFILGWRAGYPDDPNTEQLFGVGADIPGGGYNFSSYNSDRFNELEEQAKAVPGCAAEDRAELYLEMQEIIQADLPYLFLYAQNGMYVARNDIVGFDPFPAQMFWNVGTWRISSD